jgi:hypothetical protein
MAKTFFHASCNDSKEWEVNNVVGQVEDFMVSDIVVVNLLSQLFKRGFLLSIKEIFDKLLAVYIENVFVFFVLFEQLVGSHDVLIEHGLDLIVSFNDPGEFFSDREIRLLLLLKEGHEIVFKVAHLVS